MPVWRDLTKELRESGELNVVGIVQEQHPDRTRLYAAWQNLDFPILWDPFNTTGIDYVLVSTFVDGYGVVRATGLSPRNGAKLKMLLNKDWLEQDGGPKTRAPWITPDMGQARIVHASGSLGAVKKAMSRFLWASEGTLPPETVMDDLVQQLEERLDSKDVHPEDHFRAGVARRLRLDSPHAAKGDAQASIDHWVNALTQNPNQYIWRRRIQQWGPRLDKPYPFYDWVDQAFEDLKTSGHAHAPLIAALSGSEVAGKPGGSAPAPVPVSEPDPKGQLHRDKGLMVRLETAAAPNSKVANKGKSKGPLSARIHITLRPLAGSHWTPDTEPAQVWLKAPEGWSVAQQGLHFPPVSKAQTAASCYLDFEISAPKDATTGILKGYAVYSICKPDGTCLFRRQDFSVQVRVANESENATGPPAK
ncbi:MAG: hypothetical protein JKY61_07435 [Planctomycetes bacterium]|nr:hypothetical protein [Planctomycetota bacterium]